MIILRKDQLQVAPVESEIFNSRPAAFDFEKDGDSAQSVVNILFDRMDELGGVGLSANQVGVNLQVFVMGKGETRIAVFNPEVVETIGEEESFREGCISYPGMFLYIKRPKAVKVKYQNAKGEVIETVYAGITARIFLHEYDHMQGKNYTMYASRMKLDLAKKRFQNKKRKLIKKFAQKQIFNKLKESRETNG